MDEYRLYFLDQHGERVGAFDFTSTDDQRAQAAAQQFGCEHAAELWCRSRQVGEWRREPEPEVALWLSASTYAASGRPL